MYRKTKMQIRANGFSLIELMVAMLIGLLVLAGVIQVVLNSKRSFIDNQEVAFIQDNTRYALDIIIKDLRSSGYKGCARSLLTTVNVIDFANIAKPSGGSGTLADAFAFNTIPFNGTDTKDKQELKDPDVASILPSGVLPDTITIQTLPNEREAILNTHNPKSGDITTSQPVNFPDGTPLMIIDAGCQNVALVAGGTAGLDSTTIKPTKSQNCSTGLTSTDEASCTQGKINTIKPIQPGSAITPYLVNRYFIGKASAAINNTMPALKRQYLTSISGTPTFREEEIAQGVEDMQITYGIDNGQGRVDKDVFITADEVGIRWDQVVAVRIELTLRSGAPVQAPSNGNDGYLRKKVASTVSLRNYGG
ncbi:MAG: PilW family protein [Marinagarivorans sp.]